VYCFHSCIVVIWGLATSPQNTFLEANCLKREKMPLHKIGMLEMGMNLEKEFGMKGTSCPLPPMKKAERAAAPPPSSVGVSD